MYCVLYFIEENSTNLTTKKQCKRDDRQLIDGRQLRHFSSVGWNNAYFHVTVLFGALNISRISPKTSKYLLLAFLFLFQCLWRMRTWWQFGTSTRWRSESTFCFNLLCFWHDVTWFLWIQFNWGHREIVAHII